MSAGAFIADAFEAAKAGWVSRTCHWCGNWTWVAPDNTFVDGRVFCSQKGCEEREGAARREAAGR